MAWNGSGTYSRTDGTRTGTTVWTQAQSAGVNIVSSDHDTHDQDIATAINNCLAKDGQNSATANLNIGGNKITNLGKGTSITDAASIFNIADATGTFATTGGSANAYTLAPSPSITAYVTGQTFRFIASFTNTGAATLNVNSLGAKNIYFVDGASAMFAGAIVSGSAYQATYDGTQFRLMSEQLPAAWLTYTPSYSASGAMTYTSVTTTVGKYIRVGKLVIVIIDANGTTGGTANNTLIASLPFACVAQNHASGGMTTDGGNNLSAVVLATNAGISVSKYDGSNYGLGATRYMRVTAIYEAS